MEWYYAKANEQHGPVTGEDLRSRIASGEIASTDLVWREGMPDWIPAGEVKDFAGDSAGAITSAGPPPPGGSQMPQAGIGGGVSGAPVAHQPIPNYLVQSILVTIFCCQPFGIVAIIFAAKVDGLVARGDIAGAMDASKKAKTWAWVGFGVGAFAVAIYAVMVMGSVAAEL